MMINLKTEKIIHSMARENLHYLGARNTILNCKPDLNNCQTPHVFKNFVIIKILTRLIETKIIQHHGIYCFFYFYRCTVCLYSSKGQINATRITAIAAGQYDSDVVEVRARVNPSQTFNFKCDIVVNGKIYYFNFTEEKVQIFKSRK